MAGSYIVYGQKGTGSVPVEATLHLLGEPYRVIERIPEESPGQGDLTAEAMARINPMAQVPALGLPDGQLMTESAAILIHLADSHPASRLAPALDDPMRPAFLRWMTFIAVQIYGLIWVTDDLRRLAADESHQPVIRERVRDRIAHCWRTMDAQVDPGRYLLGDDLTVLDIYVTVVSAWGPRRERFYGDAPKMAEVVRRVDRDPRLQDLWRERFG
ncbi:glutathione S-transferase family protein [Marinivivus vitaminiproducens]|uniref:glutathione S-transferase family protein n=1 Tax=Marinivivus vitaminiproducens TaxID=3035935 RepID=UPI00279E0F1D|nr:glutathione S-transferase family protein [Geminicoccaceae bacterium SCSIO 64248]